MMAPRNSDSHRKLREIAELDNHTPRCPHEWGLVVYDPRRLDDENTPARTVDRWSRRCTACGKIEHTEFTTNVARPGNHPGTSVTERVPDFGDDRRPTLRTT